jgi:hypothetical protein
MTVTASSRRGFPVKAAPQAIAAIRKLHEAARRADLYNARLIPIYSFDWS